MKPTKETAVKVLELLSYGLVRGAGVQEPGKMCVEAAVCCALGLPHGDNPPCVAPSVRAFKIALNDSNWSSNMARGRGMARIGIAQLGSNEIDETVFVKELALGIIRNLLPVTLTNLADLIPACKENLIAKANDCRNATDLSAAESAARSAAWSARSAARSTAWSTAWSAAWSAQSAAESAAESAAWSAQSAAESAARSAAWSAQSAARSAVWSAAESAARSAADKVLCQVAEIGVQALIAAKSPGCEWLDLVPREAA